MTPLAVQSPTTATATFNLNEVHNISVGLLQMLDHEGIPVGVGSAALGLTLGRLTAPAILSDEEEVVFVQGLFEWLGAYWTEGSVN
jgi:hypothetical protein